ncbi:MAG: hypothetical protein QGI45_03355 [Myxococcota bacterium]|jgi:hypothetical protein|nr:hypothetical protein [Myxococcota bacterium]
MRRDKWIKISDFSVKENRLNVTDKEGQSYTFAVEDVVELAGMTEDELSRGEIIAGGLGLRWDKFDLDLFVTPVVAPERVSSSQHLT